jgi:hypothetical protein
VDFAKISTDLDVLQKDIDSDKFSAEKISTKTPVHSVLSSLAVKLDSDRKQLTKIKSEVGKKLDLLEKNSDKVRTFEATETANIGYTLLSNVTKSDVEFFFPKVRQAYEKLCNESGTRKTVGNACDKAVELTMYEMYRSKSATPFAKKYHQDNCEAKPDFKNCPKLAFAAEEFLGDRTWLKKQCATNAIGEDFQKYCQEKVML